MENIDVESLELRYQSLLEQVSQQAATYEDRVAQLRVNLHKANKNIESLQARVAELSVPEVESDSALEEE